MSPRSQTFVKSSLTTYIWRIPLNGGECLQADIVDIGSQPKDLSLAINDHQLALISIETRVVLLKGTQVLSNVDLGFTVSACAIAVDGNEAIVGGQDGKLHIYSVNGDTLTQEAVLENIEVKVKNTVYHTARINNLAWSPDNHMVAAGSLDTCVIVYEVENPAS
ncbi:hypothetical protein L2E82_48432 [Cichorium intybus]|uniref:Uncharacterized protein n=1 Tax=Cichorium intybus TaxID=13427 RepID=A0ACB8YY14_CICIN|nr:hypothetical protein L2E82_48432 [Cichorium intybus]